MRLPALWLLASILLFVGCGSENEDICPDPITGPLQEREMPLEGRWELTALEGSTAVDLSDDDIDNPSTDLFAQFSECGQIVYYIFGGDRNMQYFASSADAEGICEERQLLGGTWAFDGSSVSIISGCSEFYLPIELDAETNTFTVTVTEDVSDYKMEVFRMEVTLTFSLVTE